MNATKTILSSTRKNENSSVTAIANRAGVPTPVARQTLSILADLGLVIQSGVKQTGKRGRPAHLYRRAESN
jgi:predicted ArsR family transcriptional regulator